jgi:hypothetical protein
MRRATLVSAVTLGLAACAPILEAPAGPLYDQTVSAAAAFCAARASGDAGAVADLFVPEVAAALRAEVAAGRPLPLYSATAGGPCTAGRAWYLGGSRRFAEVRHAQGSDGLDLWLSGQGLIDDLVYGDGSGTLRQRLGLRSGTVPPPASLFRR